MHWSNQILLAWLRSTAPCNINGHWTEVRLYAKLKCHSHIYYCSLLVSSRCIKAQFSYNYTKAHAIFFFFSFQRNLFPVGPLPARLHAIPVSQELHHKIIINQWKKADTVVHMQECRNVSWSERNIELNDGLGRQRGTPRSDGWTATLPREITPKCNNKMINEVIVRTRWHSQRGSDVCWWQCERRQMALNALFHCWGAC